ncbi:hypothetical protein G4G28_11000 [Massilia sp. Dwa41.01b]|uniref:hypothetical protein n=1 Tax=unclassified Massilia TaxID=2609279 RepID=UPI001604488C|nr:MULTISPECIES: hypothetical protein [unclassified Massilia]QNA88880.1 hypothetical protein G4G28_11000 [Massilia sp. Dwa41.01b]QNA99772.1 hypothetical protein G4G31_14635 [Massilia sp. Se16.2.3]
MMRTLRSDKQRGASLFELALGAIAASLLAGVLLNSIITYIGESERVAVKQLIGSLRTALAVRSAQVISTRGEDGLIALAYQNPMDWLMKRPQNYLGEYYAPEKDELPTGNWYFDKVDHTLVYLPSVAKSFSWETSKFLMFKVKFIRVPSPVDSSGRNKVTTGLVLDQIPDQTATTPNQAASDPHLSLSENNQ